MSDRFDDLWADYLEGDLDADGWAALEAVLAADPALARRAADLYADHRLLGLAVRPADEGLFVREVVTRVRGDLDRFVSGVGVQLRDKVEPARPRRRWLGYSLVATAAVALTLAAQWGIRPAGPETPAAADPVAALSRPVNCVATLGPSDGCRWAGPLTPSEGQRLPPGELRLAAGTAIVRFDGGASVIVTGPATLSLESATTARLTAGTVTVRASGEAFGFTLSTPTTEVVDLGTEFAVSVGGDGATEVHVLEGLVELHPDGGPDDYREAELLSEGRAVRVDSADPSGFRDIPLAARRFVDLLPLRDRGGRGRVLAYEGFDYSAPQLGSGQADGGFGWASAWCCGYYTNPKSRVVVAPDESLSGPLGFAAPHGGRAVLAAGDHLVYKRKLADPVALGADSVRYVSFLVRRDPATASALRFILCGSRDVPEARVGFGVLVDGRPFTFAHGVPNAVGSRPLTAGTTYLIVGKVMASRAGPDILFLRVYGPTDRLDSGEPTSWTVTSSPVWIEASADELHIGFVPRGGYSVDEIRLGTTWESVTPVAGDAQ